MACSQSPDRAWRWSSEPIRSTRAGRVIYMSTATSSTLSSTRACRSAPALAARTARGSQSIGGGRSSLFPDSTRKKKKKMAESIEAAPVRKKWDPNGPRVLRRPPQSREEEAELTSLANSIPEWDKLEPVYNIDVSQLPPRGPPQRWMDCEEVRKATVKWEETDEEEIIELLLTCMNARSDDEKEAAKGLVTRSNEELRKNTEDSWLRCTTGLVARELGLDMEARDEFQKGLDDMVDKVQKLCDEHLSDVPPEAEDPEELWWLMTPDNYYKKERYWPPWVRAPRGDKHFKINPKADDFDIDIIALARKLGITDLDPEQLPISPDEFTPGKNSIVNDGNTTKKTTKDEDLKETTALSKTTTTTKTTKTMAAPAPTTEKPASLSATRPVQALKRRKIVALDEALPPKPKETKKKKHSITDIFGDKLNVIDADPVQKALLETFIAKQKRPPGVESKRIKINEETTVDPKTGNTLLVTLYVLLDWDKHSFRKTRTQKKVADEKQQEAPSPQQPNTGLPDLAQMEDDDDDAPTKAPAGVPDLALVDDDDDDDDDDMPSPPAKPPAPKAPSGGLPELALMDDDDDDIPDVD